MNMLFGRSFFVSVMLLMPCTGVWGEDWSRFRGPNGGGKLLDDTGIQLPATWGNDTAVRWKSPVPRGASSPIVVGNQVLVTGYTGYAQELDKPGDREQLTLHILSFHVDSGELMWDYSFKADTSEQEATPRIADHGYASPTPCADQRAVYAAFGPSGIVACDLNGNFLWKATVGTGTAGFGAASSPIEFENVVIVNASIESKSLVALSKQDGSVVWKVENIDRAWTTPALVHLDNGATELVIHYENQIRGFDPRTGDELWQCAGIPDYIVPCPVVDGEIVYFSGGRQNRTLAVRAGGRGDVTDTAKLWEVTTGANVTSPLLHDGYLYWSHDKGLAQCVDAKNGEIVYQERFQNRERVYASIIYGDDKFYLTQRDGTTLVLKAQPKYEEVASNKLGSETGEQFNSTPAIYGNSLLLRSTNYLYRLAE
jgi:outer membrane protein assembly factor BamB